MKLYWFIIFFTLALTTNIKAQDSLINKNNIICYGGIIIGNKWSDKSFDTRHNIELHLGLEYFFVKRISVGIELDYSIEGIIRTNEKGHKIPFGDYYTTAYIGLYSNQLYYIKQSFILHNNPTERAYPFSFREYRYTLGFGKRFILTDHITGHFETNISRFWEHHINGDGQPLQNHGMILSFDTGIQICFSLKTKSK